MITAVLFTCCLTFGFSNACTNGPDPIPPGNTPAEATCTPSSSVPDDCDTSSPCYGRYNLCPSLFSAGRYWNYTSCKFKQQQCANGRSFNATTCQCDCPKPSSKVDLTSSCLSSVGLAPHKSDDTRYFAYDGCSYTPKRCASGYFQGAPTCSCCQRLPVASEMDSGLECYFGSTKRYLSKTNPKDFYSLIDVCTLGAKTSCSVGEVFSIKTCSCVCDEVTYTATKPSTASNSINCTTIGGELRLLDTTTTGKYWIKIGQCYRKTAEMCNSALFLAFSTTTCGCSCDEETVAAIAPGNIVTECAGSGGETRFSSSSSPSEYYNKVGNCYAKSPTTCPVNLPNFDIASCSCIACDEVTLTVTKPSTASNTINCTTAGGELRIRDTTTTSKYWIKVGQCYRKTAEFCDTALFLAFSTSVCDCSCDGVTVQANKPGAADLANQCIATNGDTRLPSSFSAKVYFTKIGNCYKKTATTCPDSTPAFEIPPCDCVVPTKCDETNTFTATIPQEADGNNKCTTADGISLLAHVDSSPTSTYFRKIGACYEIEPSQCTRSLVFQANPRCKCYHGLTFFVEPNAYFVHFSQHAIESCRTFGFGYLAEIIDVYDAEEALLAIRTAITQYPESFPEPRRYFQVALMTYDDSANAYWDLSGIPPNTTLLTIDRGSCLFGQAAGCACSVIDYSKVDASDSHVDTISNTFCEPQSSTWDEDGTWSMAYPLCQTYIASVPPLAPYQGVEVFLSSIITFTTDHDDKVKAQCNLDRAGSNLYKPSNFYDFNRLATLLNLLAAGTDSRKSYYVFVGLYRLTDNERLRWLLDGTLQDLTLSRPIFPITKFVRDTTESAPWCVYSKDTTFYEYSCGSSKHLNGNVVTMCKQ